MKSLVVFGSILLSGCIGAREQFNVLACRPDDNVQICDLVKVDQAMRNNPDQQNEDAARQQILRSFENKAVRTEGDFYRSALLFQHSVSERDVLVAHAIALAGMAKIPKSQALSRMSALTLDRYLLTIGKPQIYRTQFNGDQIDKLMLVSPVDCSLLPKALRLETIGEYPQASGCSPD
jgi:hypothetical protein